MFPNSFYLCVHVFLNKLHAWNCGEFEVTDFKASSSKKASMETMGLRGLEISLQKIFPLHRGGIVEPSLWFLMCLSDGSQLSLMCTVDEGCWRETWLHEEVGFLFAKWPLKCISSVPS